MAKMTFESELSKLVDNFCKECGLGASSSAAADVKMSDNPAPSPSPTPATVKVVLSSCAERVSAASTETNRLYVLEDLGKFQPWSRHNDGTVPLLTPKFPIHNLAERCSTVKEFNEQLEQRIPAQLSDLIFASNMNMVIAGGALSRLMFKQPMAESDVDLFFVQSTPMTPAEMEERIQIVAKVLHARWSLKYASANALIVIRNERCITFKCANNPKEPHIQIILRQFPSVASLLYNFDLGSSAAAYNGTQFFMSESGRLAYEHGVNVINLNNRRQSSFEKRLVKYFERGFSIAMPDLDLSQFPLLPQSNDNKTSATTIPKSLETPYLKIWSEGRMFAAPNTIVVNVLQPQKKKPKDVKDERESGFHYADDEEADSCPNNYGWQGGQLVDFDAIAAHNFRVIRTRKTEADIRAGLCASALFSANMNVCSIPVVWDNFPMVLKKICSPKQTNIVALQRTFGKQTADALVKMISDKIPIDMDRIATALLKPIQARAFLPPLNHHKAPPTVAAPASSTPKHISAQQWYSSLFAPKK